MCSCPFRALAASALAAALTLIPPASMAEQPTVVWSRPAHASAINAVAYSPGGALLVTAGADHTVRFWNAADGAPLGALPSQADEINCLAFNPAGTLLATGGQDSLIHVVRLSDRQQLYTTGGTGFVESVAFSPDGATICAGLGYFSREQDQFRASDGALMAITHHHWGTVWSVAYSTSGSYLATSGADSRVILYAPPTTPLVDLAGHQDDVVALQFSPDNSLLASAGLYDHRLLLHQVPSGTLARAIDVGNAMLHGVAFSPGGDLIAAAGEDWPTRGRINLYRVADGALLHQYTEGTALNVGAITWSPGGAAFAFGRQDGTVIVAASPTVPGACYANCDQSAVPPILNTADFTCFLQRFAAADTYANCDGSTQAPVLNVADFTCFLQRFAEGCP